MIILLDNGHGVNTRGKQSPDGRLKEYAYTREIARRVETGLTEKGFNVRRIVPEETDISLMERCRRVNAECARQGAQNVVLVSIHNNAAGNGQWLTARGFSPWIYTRASHRAQLLAKAFQERAESLGLKGNRAVPTCKYWTANFYILKNTACPAVLTENLFQDNRQDVDFLLSEEGKQTIAKLHIDTLAEYCKN
mgnify:CR=1 FL=1